MKSRGAQEIFGRAIDRASTRSRGFLPPLMRMGAARALEALVPDPLRLPVKVNTSKLQDGAGNTYFLPGFSALGGPDKLR